MNFHDWVLANPTGILQRAVISILLPVFRFLPPFSTRISNALMCERFVSGMPHLGSYEAWYRLQDVVTQAHELNYRLNLETLILGGGPDEQEAFLSQYKPHNLVRLKPATNTPQQIEAMLEYLRKNCIYEIILLAHETECTKAILTCIKQADALASGMLSLQIYPYCFIEPNRAEMSQKLRELITIYEAFRLTRYQRKGHIATLEEGFTFLRARQYLPFRTARVLCVIY